ncbi:MAG: hypothetical protein KAT46_07695 [Deltaproteobacteria bacterium]|nr:hypothetical protein [Deltaproteobacteria bacterium]
MNFVRIILFRALLVVISVIVFSSNSGEVFAEDWTGNFSIFKGSKGLDKGDWEPVEGQSELGLQMDFRKDGWPINGMIEILYSEEDKLTSAGGLDVEILEINAGVRKILVASLGEDVLPDFLEIHPFVGGGLSLTRAEMTRINVVRETEDDYGFGIWLDVGCYLTIFEAFNVGLALKYTDVDLDLFGTRSAGGTHFGLTIGFHY